MLTRRSAPLASAGQGQYEDGRRRGVRVSGPRRVAERHLLEVKGYVHPMSWYADFSPVTVG
jgi:hypothetical protein